MALSLEEFVCFWIVLRMDGNKVGFPSFCAQEKGALGKTVADFEGAWGNFLQHHSYSVS